MTDTIIRDAGPGDIPALHALIESAYRGESSRAGWTTEANLLTGQRTDPDELAEIIADPEQALKSVSTIAYELGFGSLGPFNRAFRAAVGVPPTAWRQEATPALPHLRLVETAQAASKADKRA